MAIKIPIWSATQDQVLGKAANQTLPRIEIPSKVTDTEGTSQSDPCMIFNLFRVVAARPETSAGGQKKKKCKDELFSSVVWVIYQVTAARSHAQLVRQQRCVTAPTCHPPQHHREQQRSRVTPWPLGTNTMHDKVRDSMSAFLLPTVLKSVTQLEINKSRGDKDTPPWQAVCANIYFER